MEKLRIIKITDSFKRDTKREICDIDFKSQSLLVLREEHAPKDVEIVTSLNGAIIKPDDLDSLIPKKNDCIVFLPVIQGGGDDPVKTILTIAVVAVMIAIPGAGGYAASVWGSASGAGYYLTAAAMYAAGGMLINAINAPRVQDLPSTGLEDSFSSATYGWTPQTLNE